MLIPVLPCAPTGLFSREDLLQRQPSSSTPSSSTSKCYVSKCFLSSGTPKSKRKKSSVNQVGSSVFFCFFLSLFIRVSKEEEEAEEAEGEEEDV